jgi:cytochrome c2
MLRVFWYGLSAVLVAIAPTELWDGVSFWTVPLGGLGQALLGTAAFLALAVWLEVQDRAPGKGNLISGVVAAAVCYGAAYLVFGVVRPDLGHSRAQFAMSAVLGISLAFLPRLFPTKLAGARVAALGLVVAAVVLVGFRTELTGTPERRTVRTALKSIALVRYPDLIPPVSMNRGGAIEPLGSSLLLVTGDGEFYVVEWGSEGNEPVAHRLPLTLAPDPRTPDLDASGRDRSGGHRVLDLKIDTTTSPATVFVASQERDPERRCFTVRVSVASLPGLGAGAANGAGAWAPIFETSPCLDQSAPYFAYLESGGRLALLGDKILLTVGDFGLGQHAPQPPSQAADSPYGKVLLLDRSGGHEIFTLGHRNPQGLLVDSSERIWLTEHGPQGGDELNLLERGRNYGYPFAMYGTDYGSLVWSRAPGRHDHGTYAEPVQAFVPSIAIANLIRVESAAIPEWKGDLLIASLHQLSLYRARIRDDRVIYIEPIYLRTRIRDLAEMADGRLVLWTDGGKLFTLTASHEAPVGSVVFERCRVCHESDETSAGPPLRGVVGSAIARQSGYSYTPALQRLGGVWTEERLGAFLEDPSAFAPGSNMAAGQVTDAAERRAVIEFLKTYK